MAKSQEKETKYSNQLGGEESSQTDDEISTPRKFGLIVDIAAEAAAVSLNSDQIKNRIWIPQ